MTKDYFELNDELEEQKESILAEAYAREELLDAINAVVCGVDEELLERALYTADKNPLSESAEDIKEELAALGK